MVLLKVILVERCNHMNETMCDMQSPQTLESISDTLRGNLNTKKKRLESQLADVNNAIEAMDANPEVTKVMELVLKGQRC